MHRRRRVWNKIVTIILYEYTHISSCFIKIMGVSTKLRALSICFHGQTMAPYCLWSDVDIYLFLNAAQASGNLWRAKLAQVVSLTAGLSDQLEVVAGGRLQHNQVRRICDTFFVKRKEAIPSGRVLEKLVTAWLAEIGFLSTSPKLAIGFYSEPDKSNPIPHTLWHSNIFYFIFQVTSRSATLLSHTIFVIFPTPFRHIRLFAYYKLGLIWLWRVSRNALLHRWQ
jgi:hypothetical protein